MKTRIAFNNNANNWLIGIGEADCMEVSEKVSWEALDAFIHQNSGKHVFTVLSYDLGFEVLPVQKRTKERSFPLVRLWTAKTVFALKHGQLTCIEGTENVASRNLAEACLHSQENELSAVEWKAGISKERYLQKVELLQQHIQRGDIYEINFCQEFYAENITIQNPLAVYRQLNEVTTAPFSCFVDTTNWMLASASPERFLQKNGQKLISQPIKGTAGRGANDTEDQANKHQLFTSPKERSENVMIVDLVRNDLSRIAEKGSVRVEELFGIHTFPTVHQMISTVACDLKSDCTFSSILKATFPMGSMTGAPKISAVQLAENTEDFARELYSGSVGVVYPNGDFDSSVVIRSLFYNKTSKRLSVGVGGAITINASPEAEYQECKTKVGKILSVFGTCEW